MANKLGWSHDGTTFKVASDDVEVLETPFGTMPITPAEVLGKDAATGLPKWSTIPVPPPPPPPVSSTFGDPDPTGAGGSTDPVVPVVPLNPERACGGAVQMGQLLHQIYRATIWLLNSQKNNILRGFLSQLAKLLSTQLLDLLTVAELGQFEIDAAAVAGDIVVALAGTIIASGTSLPDLTAGQMTIVTCTAWSALWLRGGDYLAEAASPTGNGTRGDWVTYLNGASSFFDGAGTTDWQLTLLKTLIGATPDNSWADAAAVGASQPSKACMVCGGYPP